VIFADTWAWLALAGKDDQYHTIAQRAYRQILKRRRRLVTTDYVLSEVITNLYRRQNVASAQKFVSRMLQAIERGDYRLVDVSPDHFHRAWLLRQKYHDKPDISFVDFTSMVVMQDLGITEVFTGDDHFRQVNLGFQLVP
jgi:predicted nucleic acid-binding protein